MGTLALTAATFDEVTAEGIVLVDFWADWCVPCKQFAPTYEALAEAHPDIVFGKVDTEAEQELAARFEIRAIPTIMAVKDGVMVYAQPGGLTKRTAEQLIEQVRALDMDKVREELAAR